MWTIKALVQEGIVAMKMLNMKTSCITFAVETFGTPLEKRTQVWFELQEEISFAHEFLMKMLPEKRKIKKIYRGTYSTDVQILGHI